MNLEYNQEPDLSAIEFQNILITSTLAPRRPTNDLARLDAMLRNADVIITARDGNDLIGVSRAITDRAFATYLSDLAVDQHYQGRGIGKRLIHETHSAAGLQTTLYLVAAPAAEAYYPKIGMTHVPSCWKQPALE